MPRPQVQGAKTAEAHEKEQRHIKKYKDLDAQVRNAVSGWRCILSPVISAYTLQISTGALTEETLKLTSQLLTWNPEYYTVWNHRRRVLRSLPASKPSGTIRDLVQSDLDFLVPLLLKFPKCYWIWKHRWWLLQQCHELLPLKDAEAMWIAELSLVGKMLTRDNRNFHGWNYRREVVSELPTYEQKDDALKQAGSQAGNQQQQARCETEFAYTTAMIRQNLSNFSAWHNRSQILPQLLEHRQASAHDRRSLFDSELALIKEALFIDPYDQSLWFYHQYLMSVLRLSSEDDKSWVAFSDRDCDQIFRTEIKEIAELLNDTRDCKWIYQNLVELAAPYRERNVTAPPATPNELRAWLVQLKELDPLRLGRWIDWERKLVHDGRP